MKICSICAKRLEAGEITDNDVKISRCLAGIDDGLAYMKSFEAGGRVYILVEEPAMGKVIGRAGKNVKKLAETLKKDVKVLQKEDEKTMLEKALNTPVNGMNKVYGENEFYRIRLDRKARRRLKAGFEKVVESIVGKSEIVFE